MSVNYRWKGSVRGMAGAVGFASLKTSCGVLVESDERFLLPFVFVQW